MNAKNSILSIDVSPDIYLYRILQRQPFGINIALAEFIDNSIQSFRDEEVKLNSINLIEPTITIFINSDPNNSEVKTITIKDNAAGILLNDFQRVMKPGLADPNTHSSENLSVYGVGMKFAAVWLSNTWKLETSHISSNKIISIDIDLNNLLRKDRKEVDVIVTEGDFKDHYTHLTITNCKRPITKELCELEILPYLLETFERFNDINIELLFDNERIIPRQDRLFTSNNLPATMVAKPYTKSGTPNDAAKDITWERQINWKSGDKKVNGFIRLINPASYYQPGIRLLRNNRVIMGTGVYPNIPVIISGTNNKYGRQRIYGELHLDGFTVNDKKNGFDDDLNEIYQAIRERITETPNLIAQANNFRVRNPIPYSGHQKPPLPQPTPALPEDKSQNDEESSTELPSNESSSPKPPYYKNQIPESYEILDRLTKLRYPKLRNLYKSMCDTSLKEHSLLSYLGSWCFWEILLQNLNATKDHGYLSNLIIKLMGKEANAKAQAQRILDSNGKGNLVKHDKTYISDASDLIELFDELEPVIIAFLDEIIEKESRADKYKQLNAQSAKHKASK